MKNLETLIQELCPDGVEFVKLGDCCSFKRGTTITAKMQFLEMYLFWLVVKNQLIIITRQTERARLLWLLVRGICRFCQLLDYSCISLRFFFCRT